MLKSNSRTPSSCSAAMVRSVISRPGERFDHLVDLSHASLTNHIEEPEYQQNDANSDSVVTDISPSPALDDLPRPDVDCGYVRTPQRRVRLPRANISSSCCRPFQNSGV